MAQINKNDYYEGKMISRKITDSIIEKLIFASGIAAIILVSLIFFFLLREGLGFFAQYSIKDFLLGHYWYPTSNPAGFGILSLIMGSVFGTLGAAVIFVPVGVMSAFSAFSGSLVLALMAMPTIVSIAEDAIRSVPWTYKEAALSLGATKWQTMYRIVLPAAAPGILAAVMLGIGRVIGETMAVMMITGNAAAIPESIFDPVRTMTATIAAEMGETVKGSMHYKGLFAIGLVLFVITFIINFIADSFLNRTKK